MYKYIFFLFLHYVPAHSVIVGSNTAPSRQAQATFPANDLTNEMRGFAAFENGFILTGPAATVLFTSFFPISGNVDMRGGRLNLARTVMFDDSVSFLSTGTIAGAGNAVHFPHSAVPFTLPNNNTATGLNLIATNDVGHQVNSVDWSPNTNFVVAGTNGGGTITGTDNVYADSFNGATLTSAGSTGGGGLFASPDVNSIRWHPTLNFVAVALNGGSDDIIIYSYNVGTGNLTQTGSGTLSGNGRAIAWHPAGGFVAVGKSGSAQSFTFNTGTGAISNLNVYTNANLVVPNNAMEWSANGNFVAAGSSSSPQLQVLNFNSGTGLSLNTTSIPGTAVNGVSWSPSGQYIAVGLTSGANTVRVYSFNGSTLTNLTSAQLAETKQVLSVEWSPDGQFVLYGFASGTGTDLRVYRFNYSSQTLTLVASLDTTLSNVSARWSGNMFYIATGNGSGNDISVYSFSFGQPFVFENQKLTFNSDVAFSSQVIFNNTCEIEGNGHVLDLTNTPSFTIGFGANLGLKNMIINGIVGSNIYCADSTGVLTLKDVTWIQTGTYTFNNGALIIKNDVLFTGTSVFVYSSSKTSTINSNATWMFDTGMTFSYAPANNGNNLIAMTDITSNLYFLNSSVFSPSTGFQLTNGSLYIDGACNITSNATTFANSFMFGNGISSSNNLNIKVLPESGFNIRSGFVTQNNI